MVLHTYRCHHYRATVHLKLLGPYMFWDSDIFFLDFKKGIWYIHLYLEHPPGESEAAPSYQIR